jgi:hypothetical protein
MITQYNHSSNNCNNNNSFNKFVGKIQRNNYSITTTTPKITQ